MSESLVDLVQVQLAYPGNPLVLDSLSLSVSATHFLAIVGPSGCGKSTLLRLMAGLIKPSSGTVSIKKNIRISFVFQEAALLPWLTVAENIVFPLIQKNLDQKKQQELVAHWLEQVGLTQVSHYLPHELSGGMKMRASLARALITNPDLLLLDEPFAALDEFTREDLQKLLLELTTTNKCATVLVTHQLAEAALLSKELVLLAGNPVRIQLKVANPFLDNKSIQLKQEVGFLQFVSNLRQEFYKWN